MLANSFFHHPMLGKPPSLRFANNSTNWTRFDLIHRFRNRITVDIPEGMISAGGEEEEVRHPVSVQRSTPYEMP